MNYYRYTFHRISAVVGSPPHKAETDLLRYFD